MLTWKDIFDSEKATVAGEHITEFMPLLKVTGYEYFTWNGNVYKATNDYRCWIHTPYFVWEGQIHSLEGNQDHE